MGKYYIVREIRYRICDEEGNMIENERYLGAFASFRKARGLRDSAERDRYKNLVSDYIDSLRNSDDTNLRTVQESVICESRKCRYNILRFNNSEEIEVPAMYVLKCPLTDDEYAYDITSIYVDTEKEKGEN